MAMGDTMGASSYSVSALAVLSMVFPWYAMGIAALRRLRSNSSSGIDASREWWRSDFLWENRLGASFPFVGSLLESASVFAVGGLYELARFENSLKDF